MDDPRESLPLGERRAAEPFLLLLPSVARNCVTRLPRQAVSRMVMKAAPTRSMAKWPGGRAARPT
ncbi:hypothetical protein G7085_03165 [Tessaracoccus sp. HDW20]|uniref:hypothetical protein n=1 Tax=Tessaracoccus coleopterorum TaxID=2714950 RepID=UPI0018D2B2B9|nr:hypothetical protein [Tessaracoccus coleopterorum]NHB84001.1 hypothetical protein [Tessaracoccus coleopterorum]